MEISILPSQSEQNVVVPWTMKQGAAELGVATNPDIHPCLQLMPKAQHCSGIVSPGHKDLPCRVQTPFQWQLNLLTHRYCPMVDTLLCSPLSDAAQCRSDGNFSCSKERRQRTAALKDGLKWHCKACLTLSRW